MSRAKVVEIINLDVSTDEGQEKFWDMFFWLLTAQSDGIIEFQNMLRQALKEERAATVEEYQGYLKR